ncbi:MAG: enoyl-CoA hydratase/isomerase family protein [Corynebacterium sp.]|nr:enoyl-CoA hydratase/isomerase family protein [Corynebacterium sp.]
MAILTEIRGKAGIITLNRPQAMNALNLEMVREMAAALDAWRDDPSVELVIVRGAGERGLCAGGDVITLYHDAQARGLEGAEFWTEEYRLNLDISEYPKPYVALQTGIVLGGGIGISGHGSHRIVTDDTRVGMPETGIGFVPDVGGSYLLNQAEDHLGTHLALTGVHVGPAEAIACGLADMYVPADQLEALVEALCERGVETLSEFAVDVPPAFGDDRAEMARVYAAETVEEILALLDASQSAWAADAARRIRRNSPLALKVTLESLRRARSQTLAEALETEFRVSMNMQRGTEFIEGVRAQLVDKDRTPRWAHATLEDVTPDMVEAMFGPVDDPRVQELNLSN